MIGTQRLIGFVSLVVLTFLAGNQPATADSPEFPFGSYVTGPFTATFKEAGTFEVADKNGVGVIGTIKITGNQIEFVDQSGPLVCPDVVGKYTWKSDGDKLIFTRIDDGCEERAMALSSEPLVRKSGK